MSDQDVILDAIEDAQRILAEHIEPTSRRTPEATIETNGTSASHPCPTTVPYHSSGTARRRCASQQVWQTDFRNGSNSDLVTALIDVGSSLKNRHSLQRAVCPICAISRRAILFDHAKLSLTAKGNELLSQGPFQEDTRLLTRRDNRATQIRLRFISISRSRRKLRPRTVRRL